MTMCRYPCEMVKFVEISEESSEEFKSIPFSECEAAIAAGNEHLQWQGQSYPLRDLAPEYFFADLSHPRDFSELTVKNQIGKGELFRCRLEWLGRSQIFCPGAFGDISLAELTPKDGSEGGTLSSEISTKFHWHFKSGMVAVKEITMTLPEERLHALREWKHELEIQG